MKNTKKLKFFMYIYALFLTLQHQTHTAEIIVDKNSNSNVTIDKGPNGKTDLVNINTPNQKGVSHNVFKEFNVDKNGVILNNGAYFTTSELSGLIYGNPNLQNEGKAAKLILNEVNGTNRSKIEGFTEITGKKADYILANPNGIFVNGAGFINVGRTTLTTGVPKFDSLGNIKSLDVNDGTIVIGSSGLDTRNISMFDMVSRTAELYGSIYGGENVNLLLGKNEYEYSTGKVTPKEDDDSEKQKLALDGRALGSLYGGRIFLQSTEKGVGVNSEGEMLADVSDLEIDINGDLIIKKAQAKRNIKTKAKDVRVKEKLLAEKKINLNTKSIINEGKILGKELDIDSKEINNLGTIYGKNSLNVNSNINNSGKFESKENIEIIGNVKNSGNLKTEKNINLDGNLENKVSGDMYGKNLDISGDVKNHGNVSGLEKIEITGNLENSGTLASGETISVQGKNIINNKLLSSNEIILNAEEFKNTGDVTGETVTLNSIKAKNSGVIYGKDKTKIKVKDTFNNEKLVQTHGNIFLDSNEITNDGDMFSGKLLTVTGLKLNNTGRIISEDEGIFDVKRTINKNIIQGKSLEFLDVNNSGSILSKSNFLGKNIENSKNISALEDITVENLVNKTDGKVVSEKDILVKTSTKNDGILFANKNISLKDVETTGRIQGEEDLTILDLKRNSGVIQGYNINITNKKALDNTSGEIKTFDDGSSLNIVADSIENTNGIIGSQGTLGIEINKDFALDIGKYIGNKEFNIKANNLKSHNDFENAGNMNLDLKGDFSNKNKFVSGGELNISANNLTTYGSMGSVGKTALTLRGFLKNFGELILGKGKNTIQGKNIRNDGFLLSNDDILIDARKLINNGQVAAGGNLSINTQKNILNNKDTLLFSAKDMILNSKENIKNKRAEIYSGGNLKIIAKKNIDNILGSIESLNNMELKGKEITNIGEISGNYTKKRVSGSESSIDTSKLDLSDVDEALERGLRHSHRHRKRWTGEKYLVSAQEGVSNFVSTLSTIKAAGNISIDGKNILNQEGNIIANKDITINADILNNTRDYREIDVKLNYKRDYKYRKRTHKTGHSSIGATTVVKQRLYGDKTTNITAGGNVKINAKKVGNGEYTKGTTVINSKNGITHGIIFNNRNDIKKDGVINIDDYIKIPEGDKGLFKINESLVNESSTFSKRKNPQFKYLIETNVKFLDKGYYLGSEYFFDRINFSPERDIRLLGDSFYETTIVNKAIYEATQKRYLNGATSDKEQMQILYDNSIKCMEDFNLSIGVDLTKEQVNNLKNDIIWYVEEEVEGVMILVPKVYLSKETLVSLDKIQGNQISARKNLNINALTVSNTGSLLGDKEVAITADSLISESIRNGAYANISGEDIKIFTKDDILNRGGGIIADKNIVLNSKDGNIINETKVVINKNTHKDTVTDISGVGQIKGENILISAGDSFINAGGELKANKDINISAEKNINLVSVETLTRKETGSATNYTVDEKVENIGSNIIAENVDLQARKNVTAVGSSVVANNNLNVKAGENINIVASIDKTTHEKHKSSSGFFSSKESVDVKYNEQVNASEFVAGNKMTMDAKNNLNVVGSKVVSDKTLEMNAGNDVRISSALQGSAEDHQSIKSGFLGLSVNQKKDMEINYTNVGSYVGAGENVDTKAGKDVTVLASDIEAGDNINMTAGRDVNILAGDDITKKESSSSKSKLSIFGSIDGLSIEIGASVGLSKKKNQSYDTKVQGSNISAGEVVNINSGNNINIEASNVEGKNVAVKAEDSLNVISRDESHKESSKTEEGEIKVTAGINLNGLTEAVESVADVTTVITNPDYLTEAPGLISDLASGQDLNESLEGREDSLNYMNQYLNGPSSGEVSAGIYAGIELSKNKTESETSTSVGSTISSKNDVNLKTETGDMNYVDTEIHAGNNLNIDSGKDINISSGKSTSESKNSSESINGQINLVTGQISSGLALSKGKSEGETNSNSKFYAENDVAISGNDLTIKGGNIEGNNVKVDVDNLHVESIQDESSSSSKSINLNDGTGSEITPSDKSKGNSEKSKSSSFGVGFGKEEAEKKWVNDQSSIVGRDSSEINVKGNTHLEGGLLGGKDTTLNTGSLSFNDMDDYEKETNIGLNANTSVSGEKETSTTKSGGVNYSAVDREQITHATVGDGTIIIAGNEKSPEGLNRDEAKAQEITKDIQIKQIDGNYASEKKDWSEVKKIYVEHGRSFGKSLDALLGTEKDEITGKGPYEEKLEKSFGEVYGELEKTIDLRNKFVGIIPTEATNGGLFEAPKALIWGKEKIYVTTYKTVLDSNGEEVYDENGKIRIEAHMKQITSEEYKKIREENPDILTSINGVLNTVVGAAEGTFNMTLSPKDLETLKTQPIQRISIHNPTNGGIADIIGCAIGKVGVMMNTDIGTKDLTKIVKADPTILRGVIAHSQATIKFTQVLKELGKTEEGRKLIKENVGTIAIAAPAVGESTLNELKELVGEDKLKILINEDDFINHITNNDPTTSGDKEHGSENYNIHMEKDSKGLYARPEELKYDMKDENGNPVLNEEGRQVKDNILGKIEVFNNEKTKTVIQGMIEKIREKRKEKK